MNEQPKQQVDRKEVMFKNVRFFSACQICVECRENYFRSCEAHEGELAQVVAVVRKEYDNE